MGRPTRCSPRVAASPTAGSPSAAAASAPPCPACAHLAEQAGRDPDALSVVPFGTIADEGKLEHYAGLGVPRSCCASVRATKPRCGRSSRRSPRSSRSLPHWSSHDRPDRRPDAPRPGEYRPRFPKIISVDDHIVEPPHLWDTWLPARFRDRGPKAERRGIGEMEHIGGGTYRQSFDPDGPQADCWVYEDLVYINKRHVAAVGFDRDDMTMSPITYDEMRPGCYEPTARDRRQRGELGRGIAVLPHLPRFCGQTFLEAKDKDLAEACVIAYNDFMVEEWCGDSDGSSSRCASSRCGTPRRRPPRSGATRPAACVLCASARSRRTSVCPASTAATGIRSSPPARRPAPSSACTSGRRPRCRRPRPTRRWPWRRR